MTRRPRSRVFWREQGAARRAYGNFRDYAAEGGARFEPLKVPGERWATTDAALAEVLAGQRLTELNRIRAERQGRAVAHLPPATTLGPYIASHLVKKAQSSTVSDETLTAAEGLLRVAVEYFGETRLLDSVSVADVGEYFAFLQTRPNRRGGTISAWTAGHYLAALSNVYRRAVSEGLLPPGFNPVAARMERPRPPQREAHFLEPHDLALLVESARTYQAEREHCALPSGTAHALIGTLALTGLRCGEALGLATADISFDRKTVSVRSNRWRGLKTRTSTRTVRMFAQLEEILRRWVFSTTRPPSELLFPSFRTGEEKMIVDVRRLFDAVAERAGWQAGEIRPHALRHSYCAARLQCTDGGRPIPTYVVSRELGHASTAMTERVYAHLGQVRYRGEELEFRVETYRDVLGDRLTALAAASKG